MRTFNIIQMHNDDNVFKNIVDKLAMKPEDKVNVFTLHGQNGTTASRPVEFIKIPIELDNDAKIKNFAVKHLIDSGVKGFAHFFEDTVEMIGNESQQLKFFDEIEKMMSMLGMDSWFNTRCDECNYIFSKYDPRFKISIDEPEYSSIYNKVILWTSHANLKYSIFNLDTASYDSIKLNEQFSIAMFFIIEFLARRRSTGNGFMNCYPTIEEEGGVFQSLALYADESSESSQRAKLESEDKIFRSMKIDIRPDGDIDKIMEWIVSKLKERK